jgi:hypothetical protein
MSSAGSATLLLTQVTDTGIQKHIVKKFATLLCSGKKRPIYAISPRICADRKMFQIPILKGIFVLKFL